MRRHIDIQAPNLRALREERHLTRRELALMLGVSPTQLGIIEAGGRVTDDDLRARILRSLDLEFEQVFRVEWRDPFRHH